MNELGPDELAQLEADINGARGPEQAEAAEAWAIENGFTVEDSDEYQDADEWEDAQEDDDAPQETEAHPLRDQFHEQVEAIEQKIGKTLTQKEKLWLVERIPQDAQILPDLVELYADQLAARSDESPEARRARALERAEDAVAEEGEADERPKAKRGSEMTADDLAAETPEGRRARMLAASNEATEPTEDAPVETLTGLTAE